MRLFFYYVSHTFLNSIKKLFRTWVAVLFIGIILIGVLVGLGSVGVLTLLENNHVIEDSSDTSIEEEQQEASEELQMSPETKEMILKIASLAIAGLIFLAMVYHIYTADKGGTNFFTMADVNFLFPSPKKPQSVLLFKILLQMGMILLASLYLFFQIPNLVINLGLSLPSVFVLMLSYIFTLAFCKLITIFVYTLTATHTSLKAYVKPFALFLLTVPILIILAVVFFFQKDIFQTVLTLFASNGFFAIPMLGWITGMAVYGLYGNTKMIILFCILTIVGFVLLTYLIWHMKADFYEDALTNAQINSEKIEAAKNGMQKKKHAKKSKYMKDWSDRPFPGEGARVFFDKTVYTRKRCAKLMFFTNASLFYLFTAIIVCSMDNTFLKSHSLIIIGCLLSFLVFLHNLGNPMALDFQTDYLYLIPENPYKKVFYSFLGNSYECFLDLFPGIVLSVILLKAQPYMAVFWMLFLVTMDFIISTTGFFVEMVLPSSIHEIIKGLFQVFLKFLALAPILVSLVICGLLNNLSLILPISSLLNLLLGIPLLLAAIPFLHEGKR